MNRLTADRKAAAPNGPIQLMYRMYRHILPEVRRQLKDWREVAGRIPDPELRKQALDSLSAKEFHCIGGAVYAAAELSKRHVLVPLIVALQTISDYLDNLCDRSTSLDPGDFRLLHKAMLDAVDPTASLEDYYALRGESEDVYLHALVKTCQSCVYMLPSYSLVQDEIRELVGLYGDLQVYKHIRKDMREPQLLDWWERHKERHPDLKWNEFAAATGSTLGMFMLFVAAADPDLKRETVEQIRRAYFPDLCALHILLDYLIDQEEDRIGGDLNFCFYYTGMDETVERIEWFYRRSSEGLAELASSRFHRMVAEGLLALYLSDPKVSSQPKVREVSRRLMQNSSLMRMFFRVNSIWIRGKK